MRARQILKKSMREFFESKHYLEVDTPILVSQPGAECHMQYFSSSYHDYRGVQTTLSLRSSPELHMKQLLAQGYEKIFQIAPSFRSGGEYTKWHHPEFTMLEWYQMGLSYEKMMDMTHALILHCAQRLSEVLQITVPVFASLSKMTLAEAFEEFAGLKLVDEDPDLASLAIDAGCSSVRMEDDFETAFFKILLERVEPKLAQLGLVCLYDYPASQAVLSVVEGGIARRFEFYFNGIELSNAFWECLSDTENKARMSDMNCRRRAANLPELKIDEFFLEALGKINGSACGNALGFDRLLALILGHSSLDDVVPFRRQFLQHNG